MGACGWTPVTPPSSSSSALWQQASVMDIDDEPFVTEATQTKQSEMK